MKAVRFSFLIYFGLIDIESALRTGGGGGRLLKKVAKLERNGMKGMNVPTSGVGKRRFLCECAYSRSSIVIENRDAHPSNSE